MLEFKIVDAQRDAYDFLFAPGVRAELTLEDELGRPVFLYAFRVGELEEYSVTGESVMDAVDAYGQDTVERIERYDNIEDARRSEQYGAYMNDLDQLLYEGLYNG